MKLIVGLGNPEDKYAGTRHNLGFLVLDEFRRKLNLGEWSLEKKLKSEVIVGRLQVTGDSEQLILVRPQTYMNNSGMGVFAAASYYKVAPEDVVIVHDELDLHRGQIKLRLGGAAAGHHGVESVINALGTDKFIRLRLGIGNWRTEGAEKSADKIGTEKYVLEQFTQKESSDVKKMIKQAIKALEILLDKGLDKAQNQFN
jgi:PTH1 family peptidyl-tRNA hydrolase